MRIDLHIAYAFYFLFIFLHAAIDEISAEDCFYIDELQEFFFQINIAGITQNVSCSGICGCTETNIGNPNCQSCCCQKRVISKETHHSRFIRYIISKLLLNLRICTPLILSSLFLFLFTHP